MRRRATAGPSRPLNAENSAGGILAVLDRLKVETVDVLGFSAGDLWMMRATVPVLLRFLGG